MRTPCADRGSAARPTTAVAHAAKSAAAQTSQRTVGSPWRSGRAEAASRHLLAETRLATPWPLRHPTLSDVPATRLNGQIELRACQEISESTAGPGGRCGIPES